MDALNKGRHDVFISYSTKNKNVADAVVADFEQHGIKCWYAPRDILPGEEWVTAITNALEGSKALVLIFTEESNNSRQVMNEIAVAFNAGLTIVPFKLTDDQMSSELEYYLTRVHWLDAVSKPLKKNIQALREYIDVIINTENGAAPVRPKSEEELKAEKNAARKKRNIIIAVALVIVVLLIAGGITAFLRVRKTERENLYARAREEYFSACPGSDEIGSMRGNFEEVSDYFPDSYYYLGRLYEREYDYESARDMYETGINNGSVMSLLGMGNLYLEGNAVSADEEKARSFFDRAVSAGCVEAYYYEALLWAKTNENDDEQEVSYVTMKLEQALTGSDAESIAGSCILLGDIFMYHEAAEDRDAERALKYYLAAAERCEYLRGDAYYRVAMLYDETDESNLADEYYGKAYDFYEMSADAGDLHSCKVLGDMYYDGIHVEMDEDRAIEYYIDASAYSFDKNGLAFYDEDKCDVSDGNMLNRIGLYYFYEAEYENAAFFFVESAERFEHVYAMANAAMAYENLMDWENAFNWYARAIEAGHDDSDRYRRRMLIMVNDGLVSPEAAKDWL
jgi:TPR repeat protein